MFDKGFRSATIQGNTEQVKLKRVAMRTTLLGLILLASFLLPSNLMAEYPERTLKIVVYTAPGGLIDVTSRKLAQLIEQQIDQTVIVENRKGAGGIVALSHVLRKPADGYTIFGLTSSVISKAVKAKQDVKIEKLQFLTRVVQDYECLITRKADKLNNLEDIINDAKQRSGKQIWAGPASSGTDHLFALKTWAATGIKAKWIPYPGGAQAIAALLGGHAQVYVGNPQDIASRPDLQIATIAAPQRLEQHPNVPTFSEAGIAALSDEVLWRGFAVHGETPSPITQRLRKLIEQALQTEEWKTFISQAGAQSVFDQAQEFQDIVSEQIRSDRAFLLNG